MMAPFDSYNGRLMSAFDWSSQVAFQCSMYRFWWLKWPWTTIAHYITQLAVHVEVTKDRPILSAAMR